MRDQPTTDPFEARGLESLYRERALWKWPYERADYPYRRRVQETIERMEYYGNLRRMKDVQNAKS